MGISVLQIMDIRPYMMNMPPQIVFADDVVDKIEKVASCDKCGECEKKCPYYLPIMKIIAEHAELYERDRREYLKSQVIR